MHKCRGCSTCDPPGGMGEGDSGSQILMYLSRISPSTLWRKFDGGKLTPYKNGGQQPLRSPSTRPRWHHHPIIDARKHYEQYGLVRASTNPDTTAGPFTSNVTSLASFGGGDVVPNHQTGLRARHGCKGTKSEHSERDDSDNQPDELHGGPLSAELQYWLLTTSH